MVTGLWVLCRYLSDVVVGDQFSVHKLDLIR